MKKFSKILVILLSLCLVCTSAIVAVSANTESYVATVGETGYATLTDALNAAGAGDTVTLTANTSIADYSVTKSVTLDLNGYTLTSDGGTSGYAFSLVSGVTFNIVGDGSLNIDGRLASSSATDVTFNLIGEGDGISINHTGTAEKSVIYAAGGTWSFINADIVAVPNADYSFEMKDSSRTNFIFKAVTIDTTGSTEFGNATCGVIYQSYLGTVKMEHCTVDTTSTFITHQNDSTYSTATEVTIDEYVVLDNCVIRALGTKAQTSLFGSYNSLNSNIYVKNSYLESTWRAITVKTLGNGALILENSYLVMDNGSRDTEVMRSSDTRVKSGSALVMDKSGSKGFLFNNSANTESYIYLEEGARLNHVAFQKLTELTASGSYYVASNETYVRFVEYDAEGNEIYVAPSASTTYTFVYDPIGNATAPYVVAKITESAPALYTKDESGNITASKVNTVADHASLSNYVYYYHDGGTRTGAFNQSEQVTTTVTNADGTTTTTTTTKNIDHGTKYVNGNPVYHYTPNGYVNNSINAETGVTTYTPINFWFGLTNGNGLAETETSLFICEFDIATTSEDGFAPGCVDIHSRGNKDGSAGGHQVQFFHIAQDGTVTATAEGIKDFSEYKLKTNGWNRISIVTETNTSLGKSYIFIDGNYVGWSQAYKIDGIYLFAMRYDSSVRDKTLIGPVTVFDNMGIRAWTDGTTVADEVAAASYLTNGGKPYNSGNTVYNELGAITVGGIEYPDINSAATAAAALGVSVQLNADITEEVTVTENCKIAPNGHTFTYSAESLPVVIVTNEAGDVLYYDFNKGHGGEVTVHWQVGNILTGEYEDVTTVVKTGGYATYEFNEEHWIYNDTEHKIYKQIGWNGIDTENPLTPDFIGEVINSDTNGHVYATANVVIYDMAQVVLAADGSLLYATESTDIISGGIFYKLASGQTYKLYRDCRMNSELGSTSRTFQNGTFSIDLNGQSITIDNHGIGFTVKQNCTLNVYSSAPGGAIYKSGELSGSAVRGNVLFQLQPIGDTAAQTESNVQGENNTTAYNSVLNVGTIEGIDGAIGSNLTLTGDCVIEPRTGDKTCEVNVEGATLIRVGQAYDALIYPRYYSGSINVKDATLINTKGGYILSAPKGNGTLFLDVVPFTYTATAALEGCTIIAANPTDPVIGSTQNQTITLNDCAISGYLYDESTYVDPAKITVSENVAISVKPGNYTEAAYAKYNVDFTSDELTALFGENGYYKITKYNVVNSALVESDLYIVVKGTDTSAIPEGAEIRELDPLTYMSTKGVELVSVTWNDLAGEALLTETYVKGGNVFDAGVTVPDYAEGLVVLKKVFTGWSALPENVQADAVITPEYDLKHNVNGVQCNLSLYSDFCINLFIPAGYNGYVTVYADEAGTDALTVTEVDIDGTAYLKASQSQLCSNASENVVFYLAVEETVGEETVSTTINVPISVVDYAETILKGADFAGSDKVLVYYMLGYANEAAKYFNSVENDAAISRLLEVYWPVGIAYDVDTTYNALNEGLSAVFDTVAVRLTDSPAFVITLNEGFMGTVNVTYAGGKETVEFDNFENTATTAENKTIIIDGMKVYNFGTTLNISAVGTMNGADVSVSGKYNLDSYVQHAETNSLAHLDLVKALRAYAEISDKYKNGTLAADIHDFGELVIDAPETLFANYSSWEISTSFTNSEYAGEITYTISDDRVKIENGRIYAEGEFTEDIDVVVVATTSKHRVEFTVTVRAFTPQYSTSLVNTGYNYLAAGGIVEKAKANPGCTIFVGDSYFTEGYWSDFYTDFAEGNYLLGIAGSTTDDWFVCSEKMLFDLDPSEIIVHIGFNDTYNPTRSYASPEALTEMIMELLNIYHEKFPEADIYYCSIESSRYVFDKSFNEAVIVNANLSAFADKCDWLTFVNTRPIFCDDETETVYDNKYGSGSHPSLTSYDAYKAAIDAARAANKEEQEEAEA